MSNKSQTVNLPIPHDLPQKAAALAKRDYTPQRDILRQALLDKVRAGEKHLFAPTVLKNQKYVSWKNLRVY